MRGALAYPGPVLGVVLLLLVSAVPIGVGVSVENRGGYGSTVVAGNGDHALGLKALEGFCLARDADGSNTPSLADDTYYLAQGTCSGTKQKAVGDIVLVGTTPGQVLTAGDANAYEELTSVPAFRYLEVDGKFGFSDGDYVYADRDTTGILGIGDIRIAVPGLTFTSNYVAAETEADVVAAKDTTEDALPNTRSFADGALTLRYFDANADGAWGNGDTLVLAHATSHQQNILQAGMVFVSASGSRTHGGRVPISATVPFMVDVTSDAMLVTTTDGGCTASNANLFLHFGNPGKPSSTADMRIQVGDIMLRKDGVGGFTRVGSTSEQLGFQIQRTAAVVFFHIDSAPGPSPGVTSADWIYLNNPLCGGNSATTLSEGDLRITGYPGFNAFTTVTSGNADLAVSTTPSTGWRLMLDDRDQAFAYPLNALTNAKWHETTGTSGLWDAAEWVYISDDNTVSAGDHRIRHSTFPVLSVVGTMSTVDTDLGLALTTGTGLNAGQFKVTGSDGVFGGTGEAVVWSSDLWTTIGKDRAVSTISGSSIGDFLNTAAAEFMGWTGGDRFILQNVGDLPGSAPVPSADFALHQAFDLLLGSTPAFITAAYAEHVPSLKTISTADSSVIRYNGDLQSFPNGDAFYVKAAAGSTIAAGNTLRLSSYPGKAAGTPVAAGDAQELSNTPTETLATDLVDQLLRINQGVPAFDPSDFLYFDVPTAAGGSNGGCFGTFDIRLKPVSFNGVSYPAGSFVLPGDTDLTGFGGGSCPGTTFAANAMSLYYFDEDRNGIFGSDDVLYLAPTGANVPDLLTIRLSGSGGAVGPSGSTPNPQPNPQPQPQPQPNPTVTSSNSLSATTAPPSDDLGQLNLAVQASLRVTREDGRNELSWDSQPGVSGYQIWSSDSPFILVAKLEGQSVSGYTDARGGANTAYLVTVYKGTDSELSADDVNNGDVPGYSGVPQGATNSDEDGDEPKGFIPTPGFAVLALALVAVAALMRRRLA